ncbi:hypothetical protein ABT340_09490 [Streptosporangium sp. NPDC000239]|uniref:hypothetical protein n=1 Tax=Streptosporangium sp. NPDC000239 TaxID=3154248 RepID=UPI0033336510
MAPEWWFVIAIFIGMLVKIALLFGGIAVFVMIVLAIVRGLSRREDDKWEKDRP